MKMKKTIIILANLFLLGIFHGYSQQIKITNLKKGEVWQIGTQHTIKWQTTGIPDSSWLVIKLLEPAKGYDTKIAFTRNTGSYTWTLPSVIDYSIWQEYKDSTMIDNLVICLLKDTVSNDFRNSTVCSGDTSVLVYTMRPFKVTSPKDTSTFAIGRKYNIIWDKSKYPANAKVKISMIPNTRPWYGKRMMIGETLNTGSYTATWTKENEKYNDGNNYFVFIVQVYVAGKLVAESNTESYPPK